MSSWKSSVLASVACLIVTLPVQISTFTCPTKCEDSYKDFPPQHPDLLFSTTAKLAPPEHLDVYYKRCNITLYRESCYKKAWDCADKNGFGPGAKYFNHFVTVNRKGRPPEWHQAVCDAWPYSLLECRKHPQKNIDICLCLNTKLTQFKVDHYRFENGSMTVCRVKDGHRCSPKSTPLKCADRHACVSQVCRAGQFLGSSVVFFICVFFGLLS